MLPTEKCGAGIMGEAGPEGVLPLKRTKSGALGVQSSGGGGGSVVNINVENQHQRYRSIC